MTKLVFCALFSYAGFCFQANGQTFLITTVAGGGSARIGDGGPATSASLSQPGGVAVDTSGDIFIADTGNNRIREVSPSGIITTAVGSGGVATSPPLLQPSAVAVDASGNLFIADTGNNLIREVSAGGASMIVAGGATQGFAGDGGLATAAELWSPSGIAVDASGNLFIADTNNNVIRKVVISGNITTVAGSDVAGFSGDGGPATSAELDSPAGVAVDASGNLFIADKLNNRIRKVSAGGTITTVAGTGIESFSGDGGPATSAALYSPTSVTVDASGNLFIAVTFSNRIREVSPDGIITTVAGNGTAEFSGDGGPATSASLSHPGGVAVDVSGDFFVADTGNNRIRKAAVSTVPAPSIVSGGVVPVYSTAATIQPGEWVSIYGANLASSTAVWTGNTLSNNSSAPERRGSR